MNPGPSQFIPKSWLEVACYHVLRLLLENEELAFRTVRTSHPGASGWPHDYISYMNLTMRLWAYSVADLKRTSPSARILDVGILGSKEKREAKVPCLPLLQRNRQASLVCFPVYIHNALLYV